MDADVVLVHNKEEEVAALVDGEVAMLEVKVI